MQNKAKIEASKLFQQSLQDFNGQKHAKYYFRCYRSGMAKKVNLKRMCFTMSNLKGRSMIMIAVTTTIMFFGLFFWSVAKLYKSISGIELVHWAWLDK